MKKILILNGPNLNLLGTREPAQYGYTTLADVEAFCREHGERIGYEVECFQSNWEGALLDKIHEVRPSLPRGTGARRRVQPGRVHARRSRCMTRSGRRPAAGDRMPYLQRACARGFRHHSWVSPAAPASWSASASTATWSRSTAWCAKFVNSAARKA